jgi:hypothetical protein
MVQRYVVNPTESPMRRVWRTTITLSSDVRIAYHYKRELSEFEEASRKLDALLYVMSSTMGVWEEEGDEDLSEGDGDN